MEKFLFEHSNWFTKEVADVLKAQVLVMPNWKWGALVIALIAALILRPIIQFVIRKFKEHNPFSKKFPTSFTCYFLQLPIERPLAWIIVILLLFVVGDAIELKGKFETYTSRALQGFLAINVIVLMYYAVDGLTQVFKQVAAKTESTYDDQLVPFASKSLKVLIVVLGILLVLQSFGLNVMSLLAGLGLGGLALALAAQDTAANLFGSITILSDNPFKVGDWVKIKDMEGTVEEIGFRSTRVRTFYNSVITIPNAMMAKETIDNMGLRPARRIRQVLGVTYETPPQLMEQFIDHIRYMISQHPKVNPETVTVNFNNFNASSLDVLVQFHLNVHTGKEELDIQQAIFLEILTVAATMNVELAYPTRTIYHKGSSSLAAVTANASITPSAPTL
ncbi:mechanosensitive ion channel family protein [Bdellovibrio bacteriovorus]